MVRHTRHKKRSHSKKVHKKHTRRVSKHASKKVHKRSHKKAHSKRRGGSRYTRKSMKGGSSVKYVKSNANFEGFNETVPYKVGEGIPAGKGSLPINGRNHYALSKDMHAPNGEIMNTSLYASVPKTFLHGQSGGGGLRSLMPQDLVNLGRSLIGSAETLYANWEGSEPPVSSSVMEQPITKEIPRDTTPLDVMRIEQHADTEAASV